MFTTLYPGAKQSDFKASDGWLDCFKKRHGIRELTLKGESMSADLSKIDPFKQDLENFIAENELSREHIFNADETGLLWRSLPSRSLCHGGETEAKNFKKAKDRVSLMACANATGTCKLPLVLIHTANSHCRTTTRKTRGWTVQFSKPGFMRSLCLV